MNIEKILFRLHRISCWAMMLLMFLFIISGYGMTKQIIDPVFATYLHVIILPIPFFLLFVLHVGIMVRGLLRRWKLFKDEKAADIYAIVFSLILLVFFLWLFFG